jgi:hypothetical protein
MHADPKEFARDAPQFLGLLERIPWFLNLGKPHRRDDDVARIHGWEEWHGPERGHGDWFGRWPAVVREHIEASASDRRSELDALWERVHALVFERAVPNVPLFDPDRDAWYGPTACVWHAAHISSLVAWHILLVRPISSMIAESWYWYSEGHWPCDFAEEPAGIDEGLVDFHLKLQVY